jgi:acyl transferase domain-containing protein
MQAQPAGRMLAVRAPADRIESLLPEGATIAAINAPELTVVSGPAERIDAMAAALAQAGLQASALVTSHAYHSPMMAAVRAPLVEAVAATPRQAARIPIVSTALARAASDQELADPAYWGQQLLSPVRFAESIVAATAADDCVLLEVGTGQTLTTLSRQSLAGRGVRTVVPCLGPAQAPGSDVENLLSALGRLWVVGAVPDWAAFQAGSRRRVALPTYPFERKRYWVEPARPESAIEQRDVDAPPSQDAGREADSGDARQLIERQLALVAGQLTAFDEDDRAPSRENNHG